MDKLTTMAALISLFLNVITLFSLIFTPIRERIFGVKKVNEGRKCLLRSEMLKIYYKNKESKTIHQYEYENFLLMYDAYKALKGNSFIDNVYEIIKTWKIIY